MSALLKPAERPPIVSPTETEIDLLIAEAGGDPRLTIKVLLYQLTMLASGTEHGVSRGFVRGRMRSPL